MSKYLDRRIKLADRVYALARAANLDPTEAHSIANEVELLVDALANHRAENKDLRGRLGDGRPACRGCPGCLDCEHECE